jgi:AraC-like DNA-binding protein
MGRRTLETLLWATLTTAAATVDVDHPPCGLLVQPDSVISSNVAKVTVRSVVGGDTVGRARISVRYSRMASNKMAGARVDTLLADDTVAPFEALWDCSQVPDQDNYNLSFGVELFDRVGRRLGAGCSGRHSVSLDRDPRFSAHTYTVQPAVWFAARWTGQRLYFAVRVRDSIVFDAPDQPSGPSLPGLPVYLQDGVEFFFDWAYDRASVRQPDDYQAMVAADGRLRVNAAPSTERPEVAAARDSTGYRIEIAFPSGLSSGGPRPGMRVGFNLVNSDREALGGVVATASWAGISDLLHHNPSQWGTLVLAGRRPWWPWAVAAALVLAGLAAVVVHRRRVRAAAPLPAELSPVLRDVLKFLEANFADENLDSAAVAKSVNLTGPYLGRIIKRETRQNFREFLNRFRVDKAKPLLAGTNLTVSEIAYKVGYTTPSLFSQAFQRYAGMPPSQYRKGVKE